MYLSIGIVILLLLLSVVAFAARKRYAVKKVCTMSPAEKCEALNLLIQPFGYCYDSTQDIISSRNDAWQREFGYTTLFDKAAPWFNMVFDCLPVYFDYQDKTWLIEFWKGQYGINIGAEIGIYYADHILTPAERNTAYFRSASDDVWIPLSLCLSRNGCPLFAISRCVWWLTGFLMGSFSAPRSLCLNAILSFPNCTMLHSFLQGLSETDIPQNQIQVCELEVRLQFYNNKKKVLSPFQRLIRFISQLENRFCCLLYQLLIADEKAVFENV